MILLASASPRRLELLTAAGLPCRVFPVDVDESPLGKERACRMVRRLAMAKLQAGCAGLSGERFVVAADTVVVRRGCVFGKPGDPVSAAGMLEALSGRSHRVLTGLAVLDTVSRQIDLTVTATRVRFRKLDRQEIDEYISLDDVLGCAGAYRIQGRGVFLAQAIRGSYSNVVGLPLETLALVLRRFGFPLFGMAPDR